MSVTTGEYQTDITIVLEASDGDTASVERTKDFGFTNTHTGSSSWSCTVPGEYEFSELKWLLADVYIYYQGAFIFRGSKVNISGGGTGEEWTLEGEGVARILKDGGPDEPVGIANERGSTAIEEYVVEHTGFDVEVHEPSQRIHERDTPVLSIQGTSDWESIVPEPGDTEPYRVAFGGLELTQTNFLDDGHDPATSGDGMTRVDDGEYTSGRAMRFEAVGDYAEWEFSPSYTLPNPEVRVRSAGDNGPEVRISVNGEDYGTTSTVRTYPLRWRRLAASGGGGQASELSPDETHTIRAEAVADPQASGGYVDIDLVTCYDPRFAHWSSPQWPNQVDANGHLPGPWLYPESYDVTTEITELNHNIAEAIVDSEWSYTDPVGADQAIAISNDGGENWAVRENTQQAQTDFLEELGYPDRRNYGMDLQLRFTLCRRGNRTDNTPGQGFSTQRITDLDVAVTTDTTQIIRKQVLDEDHLSNLQTLADELNFRFTLPHAEDDLRVVAFQRGAIEEDAEWNTRDWERSLDPGDYANRVVIRGAYKDEDDPSEQRYRAVEEDPAEISEHGVVEHRPPANPELETRDMCVQTARERLDDSLSSPEVKGTLDIDPQLLTPGYAYRVPEFDDEYHSLEQIDFSLGVGDYDMQLDFEGLGAGLLGTIVGTASDTSRLYRSV